MARKNAIVSLLIFAVICLPFLSASPLPAESILIDDVRALTLHEGRETTHRRVSAISQVIYNFGKV